MGSFQVNYNAGGTLDEVKKIKLLEEISQLDNISNLEKVELINEVLNIQSVDLVDEVTNVESVDLVDEVTTVKTVDEVSMVQTVDEVTNVQAVDVVNKIKGFASHTQPFNKMYTYSIPAFDKDPATSLDYEYNITLPDKEADILAITLTCSGYGENDHYDLFVNGIQWFDNWYCSEVKEGLFLGTSTYVYTTAPNSNIKLVFKNDSGTSKTLWFGIRMLVD